MVDLGNQLAGRRIFLTGHTGFKGAWLCAVLHQAGALVYGYALPPVEGGIFDRAQIADCLQGSTYADIRDFASLATAIAKSQAEVVIHMAAQPLVRLSYREPVDTYSINVMGTVNVLEVIRINPIVKATVIVTSDKCYENREWVWGYREDEPMGGHDPYSSSKGCAELVTSAYRSSFFSGPGVNRLASARAGNVIGGGDWAEDRLFPDFMRNIRKGTSTAIRNPNAIRPWQHVLDPISGYIALAEHLLNPEMCDLAATGWNFGPGASAECTVGQVMTQACQYWGKGASWMEDSSVQLHEAHYLKLDSSKSQHYLQWHPTWSLETAIQQTIDWYRADSNGLDMAAYTHDQIRAYKCKTAIAGA